MFFFLKIHLDFTGVGHVTNQVRIPVFFFNIALYSLNKIIILIYEYVYILFELLNTSSFLTFYFPDT